MILGKLSPATAGSRASTYAIALFLSAMGTAAYAEEGEAPTGGQQEIVVTARKVKERLQDVPVAITAIGGNQLRANDHLRIEDINQLSPSTNVTITNGHQASFTIRGLGANPGSDGLESSTGIFVDGVYLGRPGMAAMDLIDIEQIEVLRGPQGTLFGKNTTAGAVNITTALPSFDLGVRAQATFGNYNYQQYQASVTGPLSDTLAFRLTGYRTTRDGTVDNIYTGQKTSDIHREGLRAQLLFKPNDDFSVRLIGEYAREQQSMGAVTTLESLGVTPDALLKKLNAVGGVFGFDPRGQKTAADGPVETGTRQWAGSAEINWKLGGFTLTSLSAYRSWKYRSRSDTEGSSADVLFGGYYISDHQFSQEVRLAFPRMGNVDAIVGLYYFNQHLTSDQHSDYGADAAAWLSGVPNASLPAAAQASPAVAALLNYNNSRWDVFADPLTRSYAAFGQAIWHVTPRWNITGGLRETHETKNEDVSRPNPVDRSTGLAIPGLASSVVAPIHVSLSDTALSFLASTDYHFSSNIMAYGLISRGQKAGGLNATVPVAAIGISSLKVRPEIATNYEVGLKADLLSHRLILNFGAFRTDVQDYQATVYEVVNNVATQRLTNAGRVRTQGVEAEATVQPVSGLSLHGFLAYNEAKYGSYVNGPCPLEITGRTSCDLSGRPVAGAPKWTTGVNGSYEHPVTDHVTAYVSGEYSWRSRFFGALDDSQYTITGNYGLLNLRAGIRSADDHWDIAVWGKNVANKHYVANYINYGSLLPGIYAPFFGDPGTYGVTLRTSF